MQARPSSFRYLPDGRSAATKLNQLVVSEVSFDRTTFVKAVAVNLPESGRWDVQLLSDSLLVLTRSPVDAAVAVLCSFFSAVFTVIAWVIFAIGHSHHHHLTELGYIVIISLLLAATIPFLFMITIRRDRRLVVQMIGDGDVTQLFIEPSNDNQLTNFVASLVDRLEEFHSTSENLGDVAPRPSPTSTEFSDNSADAGLL